MNIRTDFLHCFFLISVFLIISCNTNQRVNVVKVRPNILFAIADDLSYPHAGVYGFGEINTPAFDQIANSGVLFHNAFVAAPQCSPSRAALLTSRNIWQIEEAGTHASSFPKKYKVFTNSLEDVGYKLGFTGKPWAPGNWKIEGWDRNPVGPEYNEKKVESVPATGINSKDYAGNFAAFLEERKPEEPFFFWYGGHEPHRVYEWESGAKAGKSIDKVKIPGFLPDDDITKNDVLDYAFEVEYFDSHLARMLQMLEEKGELENTLVVVTADNGMPFPYAKANLQEYGTHVPLAISWPTGIKNIKQTSDLVSLIDLGPTFLEIAGADPITEITGKSLAKLLYSDQESEAHREFVMTGRERHTHARPDNLGYPARALRTADYLFVKNYNPNLYPIGDPVPKNAVNDKRSKVKGFKNLYPGYHDIDESPSKTFMMEHRNDQNVKDLFTNAFERRAMEQLYDIKNDPDCINDLAKDPAYSEIKSKLRKKLDDELLKQGDPRMSGNDIFDSYPRYSSMRNFEGFNKRGEYNPTFNPDK